jgi:hypothetical protein
MNSNSELRVGILFGLYEPKINSPYLLTACCVIV